MRVAIIGSHGRLGLALANAWESLHEVTRFTRANMDLESPESIRKGLDLQEFDAVVNCAASTNVDACESNPGAAERVNIEAPGQIAKLCRDSRTKFLHISTDYVFDGRRREPYPESAPTSPINTYGRTKAAGEQAVINVNPEAVVARVSWIFGPEKPSFIDMILARAHGDDRVSAIDDKWSTPSYTADLADWMLRLIDRDFPGGLIHLANAGQCTWREYGEFALRCAERLGLPVKTTEVHPISVKDMEGFVAERPVYTVLDTSRFQSTTAVALPTWQEAVERYVSTIARDGGR